ncbi:MAG: hypothetical protein NUV97_01885 [archaeon]|nr:hypothetical protein [archaeon]MCR4323704.1 hypothetical protein [Nanoarchaeota archaeon]
MGKRGLSPVIATVLLVLLVLVLSSLIFLWARGFISEQIDKFGRPIDVLCNTVDFSVERVETVSGEDALEVVNNGDIDIYHLDVKMFDEKGNSEINKFKFNIDAGKSTRGEITLRMSDNTRPKEITVYPALIGTVHGKSTNRVFTCGDVGQTIIL